MTERVECVVVGAGVVGLAVARALALSGREVWVLEATAGIGNGASSRNSEVIHAGIYYPAGSLKARFCVEGKALLYAYCAERGIAAGYPLGREYPEYEDGLLIAITERRSREDIDALAEALGEAVAARRQSSPAGTPVAEGAPA